MENKITNNRQQNRAVEELILVILITSGTLIVSFMFNIYEKIQDLFKPYEKFQLDELIPTVIVLTLGLSWYSWRRLIESKREIQQRIKMEKKLRWQGQIIDQIHESVISTDLEGYITSFNKGAERQFGYSSKEMIGKNISLLFPKDSDGFLRFNAIDPVKEQCLHQVQARMHPRQEESCDVNLSLSLFNDTDGTLIGIIWYVCLKGNGQFCKAVANKSTKISYN
jgi:PAS domain S-box-containing protein